MEEKLGLKVKLGYGICDLGGNLFFTVMALILLNFLTDTVGIAAGLAGTIVMLGKIWDAVSDPMVGFLSDRTKSRMGRRRPYILFGSIPLFFMMVIMFTNPKILDETQLFLWGLITFCLLCTAYTLVNIPYNSLTPELTRDFHERTVLNGYRFSFAAVGTLLAAGASIPLVQAFSNRDTGFTVMGAVFGFVMMVTALITFFAVREPESGVSEKGENFFSTYLKVFGNRPYVLILAVYTLHITALTIVSGIAIYYFKYIHSDEAKFTAAMSILIITAMVFIPVSVTFSKRLGKKLTYGVGMFVFSLGTMTLFLFGHKMSVNFSLIMMFFSGIGMGFTYAMPYAIIPDTVEYDYLKTGERKEGAFYGIWTFGIKIGQAIALGITGAILSFTGYMPNVAQSDSALFGIRMLLGPIPAVIFLASILVLYFYPINEERYNEIITQIEKMEGE